MKNPSQLKKQICLAAVLACLAVPALADDTTYDWNGSYVGGHVGGLWANLHHDDRLGPSGTSPSLMGGAQIGHNWQMGHFVYGLEGDGSALDVTNSSPGGVSYNENYMFTARGRAGYAIDRFLPYATVGVAATHMNIGVPGVGSKGEIDPGIAAGAGVEAAIDEKWSTRIEYLYTDVPRENENIGGIPVAGGSQNNIVRVGFNYKF